jgi:hypothetical protein
MAAVLLATESQGQVVLHENTFETAPVGPGLPPTFFEFHGPNSLVLTNEVSDTDGVGGSNSFKQSWNSTASAADFFYFAGFGHFAAFADESNPQAGGGPGTNNPANYTFEADVQLNGHLSNTPLEFFMSAIDTDYEADTGINVNGDGDLDDGAAVWTFSVFPTISFLNNDYVHISFTMDTASPGTDSGVLAPYFDNTLALQYLIAHNNGGFGFGPNKVLNLDNVRFTFTAPEPGSGALVGLSSLSLLLAWRRNRK